MLKLPNPSPPTKKMKNKKKKIFKYYKTGVLRDPKRKKKQSADTVHYPRGRAPPRMLDRALKATAPNKLFPPAHPCPTHTQHRQYLQ